MGLTRYQIFVSYIIAVLAMWDIALKNEPFLLSNMSNYMSISPYWVKPLIDYAPIWVLFVLAIYGVMSVVIGVLNFADCPEAASEVEKNVIEAKAKLKKRGIIS